MDDGETDGDPVVDTDAVSGAVAQADEDGDMLDEGDGNALTVLVTLTEPVNDAHCEALLEAEPIAVGDVDAQGEGVDDGETEGDASDDADTVAATDAHADDDGDKLDEELTDTLDVPDTVAATVGVAS